MPNDRLGYRWQPGVGDVEGGNEATPRAGSPSNVRVLNLRIPKKPITGAIAPQALLESPGSAGAAPGFLDDLLHIFQPPAQPAPMVPPQTPSAPPPLNIAPAPMVSVPPPAAQSPAMPSAAPAPMAPMVPPPMDDAPSIPSVDAEGPVPLPIQPPSPSPAPEPPPFQPPPDVPLNVSAPPPPRVIPGSESGEPWWAMPQPPPPLQPAPVPEDTPRFTTPGERVPGGAYFYAPPLHIGGDEGLVVERPGFGRRPSPGRGVVGI